MRVKVVAPILLGFISALGCGGRPGPSEVGSGTAGAQSDKATGVPSASSVGGNGGLSIDTESGAAGGGGIAPLEREAACVATGADTDPSPVDLLFMVDITGSMNCPVPDDPSKPACEVDPRKPYSLTTRWSVEKAALKTFVSDPANQGLGVGVGFFPSKDNLCDATSYLTPTVEIGALPQSVNALTSAIDAQTPSGQTPTEPSLDAALRHATAWAQANPTHRVAVVYATDGYPQGCDADNTIAAAAAKAEAAFGGTPSIPTYVLGVGPNLADLNDVASKGGTQQAFLIDTAQNASQQLSAALASIRQIAELDCAYAIPAPPAGQTLQPGRVRVNYTDSTGTVTDVLQNPPGVSCDQGSGWEYSADMTKINLCGSLCTSIKAHPVGKMEVLFGCATEQAPGPK